MTSIHRPPLPAARLSGPTRRAWLMQSAALAAFGPGLAFAQGRVIGGEAMVPTNDIVDNLAATGQHALLSKLLQVAGLVDTLKEAGPFTVFAPDDAAFARLPPGLVDTLTVKENRPTLARLLRYHVVPGRADAAALTASMSQNDGRAVLKTLADGELVVTAAANLGTVTDENGGQARITVLDAPQSNGIVHVIDRVMLPAQKRG